jgi:hypothetical protein
MSNKKVAFIVGHANWGKSSTLRALTNNDYRQRRITIGGFDFFIRRMSNDDRPEGYIEFMNSIDFTTKPYLIAALCPQFKNPEAGTELILSALREKGYKLYFWVIEHQYGKNAIIDTEEIQTLRKFGKVEVYTETSEAAARSRSFKHFVSNIVIA